MQKQEEKSEQITPHMAVKVSRTILFSIESYIPRHYIPNEEV